MTWSLVGSSDAACAYLCCQWELSTRMVVRAPEYSAHPPATGACAQQHPCAGLAGLHRSKQIRRPRPVSVSCVFPGTLTLKVDFEALWGSAFCSFSAGDTIGSSEIFASALPRNRPEQAFRFSRRHKACLVDASDARVAVNIWAEGSFF